MKVRLRVTGHRCLAPRPPTPVRTPWHPWLSLPHPPCWATRSPLPLSSPAPLPLPLLPPRPWLHPHHPQGTLSSPPQSPQHMGDGISSLQYPLVMLRGQMISDLVSRAATPCAPYQPFPQTPAGGLCPSQGFSLSWAGHDPWADLSLEGVSRRRGGRGTAP